MTPTRGDRRAQLVDRAIAVLAKNPSMSMEQLASELDLGRATLYRHFASREDLMRAVALESIRQTDAAIDAALQVNGPESIRHLIEALTPQGDRFHFLLAEPSAYEAPDVAKASEAQAFRLAGLVERWKMDGVVARDVSTAWMTYVIDSIVWAAWLSVRDGYVARREAAALAYRTLVEGLGPGDTEIDT